MDAPRRVVEPVPKPGGVRAGGGGRSGWRVLRHGLFAVGVALAAALVALNVAAWRGDLVADRSGSTAALGASQAPSAAAGPSRVALTARAGQCFVAVRTDSKTGPLVYKGVLQAGDTRSFSGYRLWIRVGASANLTMTLNGAPVSDLPFPNGDVVVTADGVEPVS